jgi:hypothetical protein
MKAIRTTIVALAGLCLTSAALAPAASADTFRLDDRELQQVVLRAQMPTSLGAWQQYIYVEGTRNAPAVCWSATGTPVALPLTRNAGSVNYQVDQSTGGSVTVFQYKSQAAADKALRALRGYSCPNSAKVNDEGTLVPADQGTDFTSAARNSVANGVVYAQSGGRQGYREWDTTQIGLAVIQTEVRSIGVPALPIEAAQQKVSTLSAFVKKWHAEVVAAYRAWAFEGESR